MKTKRLVTVLGALVVSANSAAQTNDWGVAGVFRSATIPFKSELGDTNVTSFSPLIFYKGEYFYADGDEFGVRLFSGNDFDIYTKIETRFVDIPRSIQNRAGGDKADAGLMAVYPLDEWDLSASVMWDPDARAHGQLTLEREYNHGDWYLKPEYRLRFKSDEFNSQYYAFNSYTGNEIGSGIDFTASLDARYHVYSNLYLLGGLGVTYLDSEAYKSAYVDERLQGEVYLGIGFFNDKNEKSRSLSNKPYLRFAHGWATPSNMGDILSGNTEKDPDNNQLSSVFYGHPVADSLFGFDFDIYMTSGLVHHYSSDVQSSSTEVVLAVKAYYEFDWPTKWRFGAAEGLSYIDNVTYIESSEMERKGYQNSKLMNYLDISFDVNIGDLFNSRSYDNMWLGYSLHHRSAIFEQASRFGRIKGGSNYNTIALTYEF
ncbi:MipA/OmpV family protein [Vibrio hannami]|uniref:MipA/OmpV family protein n=1 Tax=Vibrio hannami TaxID=2717094 RepID=UPI00240F474C|nr:MipA/OmpV family protein [Vibrio hannami]MDG3086349.1 MipA/OmpV family protein [Vibrio hannami]